MKLPDMSKKIGPFPLYVWIIAAAGGLGLYFYLNRSTGGGTSEDELTEVEDQSFLPTAGANAGSNNSGTSDGTEETNEAWAARAVRYLIDKGTAPLVAQSMVSKYLAMESLTLSETALMNVVLTQIGLPPNPPTSVPTSSDNLTIPKYSSPAVRKTSNANWNDGRGVATRDYTWIDYLVTHYDHVAPDFRREIQAGWLQAYNGKLSKVKKGMNVKIPKYIWLKKWPTN